MRRLLLPLVLLALLSGCTLTRPALKLTLDPIHLVFEDPVGDEAAIVVMDERALRNVLNPSELHWLEEGHRVVRILRRDALPVAEITLPHGPQDRLLSVEGRTIFPDGRIVKLDPRSVRDQAIIGTSGRKYSAWTFVLPEATVGTVIEYRYAIKHLGWFFADRHQVDLGYPVRDARFQVVSPGATWRVINRGGFSRAIKTGNRRLWNALALEPPEPDILLPPSRKSAPSVSIAMKEFDLRAYGYTDKVQIHQTWPGSLRGTLDYLEPILQTPPDLRRPEGTRRELAMVAFELVQERVADRIGIPTHRTNPRTAREIYASGFGSADERSLVVVAILRAWQIPAGLVFMPGPESDDAVEGFPTSQGLDDLLVYVLQEGQKGLVLDPYCTGCASGEYALPHQGRTGVLGASLRDLFELPARAVRENIEGENYASMMIWLPRVVSEEPPKLTLELELGDEGLMAKSGTLIVTGPEAAQIRHYFAEHPIESQREAYLQKGYLEGLRSSYLYEGLEEVGQPLKIHIQNEVLTTGGYGDSKEWLVITPDMILPGDWMAELRAGRETPVFFEEPRDFEHEVQLELPEGMELARVPADVNLKNAAGAYSMIVMVEGRTVKLYEKLVLAKRQLAGEDYRLLLRLCRVATGVRATAIAARRSGPLPKVATTEVPAP